MRTRIGKTLCAMLVMALLAACHSGHSGGVGPSPQPATYTATLTDVQIERTADRQPLPVGGLPAQGATLTVR
jgi:hypothetical protein